MGPDSEQPPRTQRGAGSGRAALPLAAVLLLLALGVFVPDLVPAGLQPALGGRGEAAAEQPTNGVLGQRTDGSPVQRTADGGTYRFSHGQPDRPRRPVAYRSCRPLEVVVNLRGAPDPEADLRRVVDGLGRIAEATGLDVRYVGTSDRRPEWDRGRFEVSAADLADPEPALVAFADAAEVPRLEGQVAGIAGSVVVGPRERRYYLTGQVTLDRDAFASLRGRDDGEALASAITLHELGHLVGLAHVDDPGELMNAVTTDQRDLGPGDRAGLRRLGRGGC